MYHYLDEAIRSKCDDGDYDANKVTFNQFMMGKDDASKSLNENSLVKFAIGVSESKPDCYRLSYLDDNRVKNKLFKFKECENMLKFIDEKSLWYDPYDNYKFVGSDYLELSSDKESPSARRIGLFDTVNNKGSQGHQSDLGKDADSVKKSNNNNNNNNK
jgi:hypothetical protein